MDITDLFVTSPEEASKQEINNSILFAELFLGAAITVWVLYLLTASGALQDLQATATITHYIALPIVTALFAGLTYMYFKTLKTVQTTEDVHENTKLHYIVLSYVTALITVLFTLFTTVSLSNIV